MVYPADDTVLRLRLLTQEVLRLADSVKDTVERARESASPSEEAAPAPSAAAAPDDPFAAIRRAAAASVRRPP